MINGLDAGRILIAIVAAAIAASITDWFFFGVLFHDKYLQFPEVWRSEGSKTETKKILLSTVLGTISCALFIFLCAGLNLHSYSAVLKLALLVWLIGPVTNILTDHLFIKLNSSLAVSHSLGYLARLLLSAGAFILIVRR